MDHVTYVQSIAAADEARAFEGFTEAAEGEESGIYGGKEKYAAGLSSTLLPINLAKGGSLTKLPEA
ncbi:hypothetical protein ColLi_09209 [Colletotrichum liriopes]|uniref:Uncharacterized protein n=1 Tax=Colletotrichum liriopes TaxID=708192 RepID=A0AA37GSD6_9PEZI|nr:hypothetical protein ColLi_09209 [Colletotrichum liriopes]